MWWTAVAWAAVDGDRNELAERKVGLGVGTSFPISSDDDAVVRIDQFGLRWQVTPGLALDPAFTVDARHTWDGIGIDEDRSGATVGGDLTLRAYVGQHGMAHLAALVGASASSAQYDVETAPRSTYANVQTGLSVELAPEPWVAVSTDLRCPLVYLWSDAYQGDATTTLGVTLGWRPSLGAMVHVFF